MNLKFFLPILTGTLDREKRRIERKHEQHMSTVYRMDEEIETLRLQRNEHYASACAYKEAAEVISIQGGAVQIEHHDRVLGG